MDRIELLDRKFESPVHVIHCMKHMTLDFLDRPNGCRACARDVRNKLSQAVDANAWLSQWKKDADAIIRQSMEELRDRETEQPTH